LIFWPPGGCLWLSLYYRLHPDPPEISDEDWAALAQEVALTLALTVLAAYTGGAATPLVLARAARLASRMRGAYRVASRLMEKIKDPTAREGFKRRQESLEKAIKRVDDAVKRSEDRNAAEKIVRGHAWETHFAKGKELPDQVKTPQDLVKKIVLSPTNLWLGLLLNKCG